MSVRDNVRRRNALKLREAARMALGRGVILMLDEGVLRTASMSSERPVRERAERLMGALQVLGIFSGMPGEDRAAVFFRLWEEAAHAGAKLGAKPNAEWVMVRAGLKGRRRAA